MTTVTTAAAPTTATSAQTNIDAGQKNLDTSYDTFLKMLTTQLQHQDPTSPMDPNQFTQQLVQMTGVQQSLLTNQLLKQLVSGDQTKSLSQAVTVIIGGQVEASSDTATLTSGQATWTYNLASSAKTATATVSNASGQVVWSGTLPDLTAGSHTLGWGGQDLLGHQLPDGGKYILKIAATDAADVAVTTTTSIVGVAKSVRQSNGDILVDVGGSEVPLSSITRVGMQ